MEDKTAVKRGIFDGTGLGPNNGLVRLSRMRILWGPIYALGLVSACASSAPPSPLRERPSGVSHQATTEDASTGQTQAVPIQDIRLIRREMHKLAIYVRMLDEELRSAPRDPQQTQVLKDLEGMHAVAKTLVRGSGVIEHPLIRDHMRRFIDEINFAYRAAAESPPDLMYAATVVGACAACHDMRACPFDGAGCMME